MMTAMIRIGSGLGGEKFAFFMRQSIDAHYDDAQFHSLHMSLCSLAKNTITGRFSA